MKAAHISVVEVINGFQVKMGNSQYVFTQLQEVRAKVDEFITGQFVPAPPVAPEE